MSVTALPPRGVVCEDDPALRRAMVVLMRGCGVEQVAVADAAPEAVRAATDMRADFVVVDVALLGIRGLRVIGDLLEAAPGCRVVVVSPFETLEQKALDAGAYALCEMSDLRHLRVCVQQALACAAGESNSDGRPPIGSHGSSARTAGQPGAGRSTTGGGAAWWVRRHDPSSSN